MNGETSAPQIYALPTFKRRQGFTQKDINLLEKHGVLELQQGGFHGHSSKHRKNVVVLDPDRVNWATPGADEYNNRGDRRRRRRRKTERLLTAPYAESNFLNSSRTSQVHGKDHHPSVEFRISPFARKVGEPRNPHEVA